MKTALQAIATIEPGELGEKEEARVPPATATRPRLRPHPSPGLDEVLSGDADLREQAEAFPELAEEMQEVADIADLLREAGRERRRLGEEILQEEILRELESEFGEGEEDNT